VASSNVLVSHPSSWWWWCHFPFDITQTKAFDTN